MDIFGEKGIQMRLSQQIRHLKVIHPHDNLSTQMCMDCICDLKMSYKFFMQIKKAEMKLKSIQVNLTTKDIVMKAADPINESSSKQEEQSFCSGNIILFLSFFLIYDVSHDKDNYI